MNSAAHYVTNVRYDTLNEAGLYDIADYYDITSDNINSKSMPVSNNYTHKLTL